MFKKFFDMISGNTSNAANTANSDGSFDFSDLEYFIEEDVNDLSYCSLVNYGYGCK